ncbi:MAG: nucleotidyltransferase family protein [Rhodobiaceae bacterium]|nr:nucleotidyltransferase family protein [Rhodobiaceae bacterium]
MPPVRTAMVLAAGLGKRMRPLTDRLPKPLVPFMGRPLIDHVLDRLVDAGVEKAVVNVHYRADQIEQHLARRTDIEIVFSDERDLVLDTGGGVLKALPKLGDGPFFVIASDTVWIETGAPVLSGLADRFDSERMDMLLLVADRSRSVGDGGRGDFLMEPDGRLIRRPADATAPYTYASVLMTTPDFYVDVSSGPFSNNLLFDRAIDAGRLHGCVLDGTWMHVGTPQSLAAAEDAAAALAG